MITETIKVISKNSNGFIIINKSDMTKEQKEFKSAAKRSPRKASVPVRKV